MDSLRPISYKKSVKIFEYVGCVYSYTKGDHLIFHHKESIRPIVIPKYDEVPVFVIKNNMKLVGLTRKKYFEILSEI